MCALNGMELFTKCMLTAHSDPSVQLRALIAIYTAIRHNHTLKEKYVEKIGAPLLRAVRTFTDHAKLMLWTFWVIYEFLVLPETMSYFWKSDTLTLCETVHTRHYDDEVLRLAAGQAIEKLMEHEIDGARDAIQLGIARGGLS